MKQKIDERIPRYRRLINPTFKALKELGGSGTNSEILNRIITDLNILIVLEVVLCLRVVNDWIAELKDLIA